MLQFLFQIQSIRGSGEKLKGIEAFYMLINVISRARDKLIDSVLYLVQRAPYPVTHNIEKAKLLKKVFWHINIEGLHGEYFEFGVAFGNSMQAAVFASKFARAGFLGVESQERKFFGFDTFDSFHSNDPGDEHKTWVGDKFSFHLDTVARRFARNPQVKLIQGDASLLGSKSDFRNTVDSYVGDAKVAVAMLDMDLKGPTLSALLWLAPRLQDGSILIFDELFAFRGAVEKGESGALREFLESNPNISLREFSSYGDGGRAFQVQLDAPYRELKNLKAL